MVYINGAWGKTGRKEQAIGGDTVNKIFSWWHGITFMLLNIGILYITITCSLSFYTIHAPLPSNSIYL